MTQTPAYYRARILAIKHLINSLPKGEKKNSPRELLQQGQIPDELKNTLEALIKENIGKVSNDPLTFTEKTSFGTWFAMHPEKVAGTEKVTSSLYFPVKVEGTEQQIVDTVHKGVKVAKENRFIDELKQLEPRLKP